MHEDSIFANSENVNNSISILNTFSADFGGTDIFKPLEAIFEKRTHEDFPRFVFLITDGDVDQPEKVVSIVKQNAACCRLSSFGIEDANQDLILNTAQAGRGFPYFIKNASELGSKVIKALSDSLTPCILNFETDWQGDSVPKNKEIGILKYGERLLQYVLLEKLEQSVSVKYYDTNLHQSVVKKINDIRLVDGDSIFKLWANAKIEDLAAEGNKKEKIIGISKEFGVVSPYTAFVCVKENLEAGLNNMQVVCIPDFNPVAVDDGLRDYGDMEEMDCELNELEEEDDCMMECEEEASREMCLQINVDSAEVYDRREEIGQMLAVEEKFMSSPLAFSLERQEKQPRMMKNKLKIEAVDLIMMQVSEGFWKYEDIKKIFHRITESDSEINQDALATGYAVFYLQNFCGDKRDQWVLVERKSLKWMKSIGFDYGSFCLTISLDNLS